MKKIKAYIDPMMGWCITDSNNRTSPCSYNEMTLIKLGWNFTDITNVLTRVIDKNEVIIDLDMPKVRGHYQVLKSDKYQLGKFEELEI